LRPETLVGNAMVRVLNPIRMTAGDTIASLTGKTLNPKT
jgi:hypothetical protein